MEMTYFKKPDHAYHRVIFEFTDKEMKNAGFKQLGIMPSSLELLRLLQRIIENDLVKDPHTERSQVLNIVPDNMELKTIENRLDPNRKYRDHFNALEDLQRKKDGWKAKALRLIGFLKDKDSENKRLQDKYEKPGQKCGNGHINNLPIKLWDCPVCTEKLRNEKEWLIERLAMRVYLTTNGKTLHEHIKEIEQTMQQALKDRE